MCGFLVHKGEGCNYFIQKRGQDATNYFVRDNLIFTHNLLHITGDKTLQPFTDKNVVCLYNGEIYNYEFKKSDGENLIPLYNAYGLHFPSRLDGEFAIALYDFGKDIALFISDCFASKPIWRNGIECASYQSGVGGHKIAANTIEIVQISSGDLITTISPHTEFEFSNQHKDSYTDVVNAFTKAIAKRAKHRCFIGLSSGYDSGAIACELQKQKVDFKCFSILASENQQIIDDRAVILKNIEIIRDFDVAAMDFHLQYHAEDFKYHIQYDHHLCTDSYKKDYAAKGLSCICRMGIEEERKVYLSGQGADEILSDYSLIPNQSQFKGKFPNHLLRWNNFYNSCQYSYLGKEECVAGSWDVETRYPFLDKQFVQEFLWLKPELKNRNYKAPIYEYLKQNNFPFQKNVKIGFNL